MGKTAEWLKQGLSEPTKDTNKYQIELLQEQHKAMARMIALGAGNKDIAEALGVTPQMVCYARNSAVTARMVNELDAKSNAKTEESLRQIKMLSSRAVELLKSAMECEEAPLSLRLRAAESILDRGGLGKITQIKVDSSKGHFTPQDIAELKERVRGELNAAATVIEAESVPGETVQ